MLRIVFQNSVSLYDIRLIEGWSGIFGITTNGAFYQKQDCEASNGQGVCVEQFVALRDGADHTQFAIDSVRTMRGWWNFRLSHFI